MPVSLLFYLLYHFIILLMEVENHGFLAKVDQKGVIKNITYLSEEVKETSGLAFFNNLLITHNDAGNKNILYVLDIPGEKIQNRFTISDAENVDWEDLAQSEDHIFIGDIGNNDGNRNNLKIYKIKKDKFRHIDDKSINVDGIIEFHYPDQNNFDIQKKNNFDGEALIYYYGNLYIFSKNRSGTFCNIYKIPSESGNYTAKNIDGFKISGRITGAAIAPSQKKIILTGYNKKENCFLYLLENYSGDKFFSGNNTRINLGTYENIGQLEGVAFKDENTLYLSSEKTKNQKPKIFQFDL